MGSLPRKSSDITVESIIKHHTYKLIVPLQMLALSVLDSILTMDKFQQWMSYVSSKGYLQHLVDSLIVDGQKLELLLLNGNVEHMKILYLFESKMVRGKIQDIL